MTTEKSQGFLYRGHRHLPRVPFGSGLAGRLKKRTHYVAGAALFLLWSAVAVLFITHQPLLVSASLGSVASITLGLALLLTGLGGLLWRFLIRLIDAIAQRDEHLERLVACDPMTGALNHASFMEALDRDVLRSARYKHLFSVMRIDIDFFKRINDGYGHATGDAVIVELASTLADGLRNVDALGRVGGASFAIGLPETSLEAAEQLAERLRERIAGIEIATPRGDHIRFSVSVGVAGLAPDDEDGEHLLMRSEAAMQRAKDHGRNRVEIDPVASADAGGAGGNGDAGSGQNRDVDGEQAADEASRPPV